MPDNVGPHLLGRLPSPPDPRDFKASFLLEASPLDIALAKLLASKNVARATKDWAKVVTQYLQGQPAPDPDPTPTPTPPSGDVKYTDNQQLDQGSTNHCVGFGWCQWGNTLPIEDHFANADGHALYYECKVLDGTPGAENGSYVRSGAKAMQNRKRNSAYAFATSLDEIKAWLRQHGPVVVGTDWYDAMFRPDPDGYAHPTGGIAGGHCYLVAGDLQSEEAFLFQNSWGAGWGQNGYFKMKYADFDKLLQAEGEACMALELSL